MTDRPAGGRIKPVRIPSADDSLLAPLEDVVRDLADDIDEAWHTART